MKIYAKHKSLLKKHGPQGWWPVKGNNYPGDYSRPRNKAEQFEICIGTILTQNTSWKNADKTLQDLRRKKLLTPSAIINTPLNQLAKVIKSSGYYNQKAKKLKIFARFYVKTRKPSRGQLLELWGIGEETADSILLYAYKQPEFVVDAYTKRLFKLDKSYTEIKEIFEKSLPRDYKIYNEYHALIVREGKR